MRWWPLLIYAVASSALAQPPEWILVPGESRLAFTAHYEDEPFDGAFESFSVRFCFDPEALESTLLEVTIDTPSVNTRNRDRDEALAEAEWFDFENHPQAEYRGEVAVSGEEREFRINGALTLKDITRDLPIEFDWEVDGDQARLKGTARMRGDTLINRLDFDIGTGEWADPLIGHEVEVRFDLLLKQREH